MRERSADPRFTRPRRRTGDDDHGCADHHNGRTNHHHNGCANHHHNGCADHDHVDVGSRSDPDLCGNGP